MKPSDYIKRGWCQGEYARDANGRAVPAQDSRACQWCIDGAIYAADLHVSVAESLRAAFCAALGLSYSIRQPILWNDMPERTQEEAIAVLEAAERLAGL